MKLLVLSDSHGVALHMLSAVEREQPDLILHLGDGWRDAEELRYAYPSIPLEQVPGNCDFRPGEAQERLLTVEGRRIFLCHGHTLGVKQGYGTALSAARSAGAELLLFGHTHRPDGGVEGELTWMNPGSIGYGAPPTYGVVLLEAEGNLICRRQRVVF